jgi:O-acetylhomoserine (thiol)-lyase
MSQEQANSPRIGTLALHAGQDARSHHDRPCRADLRHDQLRVPRHGARGEPVRLARVRQHLHAADEPHDRRARESVLAALDGGAAGLAFASGQAAITASLLTIVHSGRTSSRPPASTAARGPCSRRPSKLGIEVRFFDPSQAGDDRANWSTRTPGPSTSRPRQPEERRAGLPEDHRHRPQPRAAGDHRQHGSDAGRCSGPSSTASTSWSIRRRSSSAGMACISAGRSSTAASSLGQGTAKWPEFTAPDPAYHGMIFEEALRPIGNIAYIIHIRTHWLRDTGATQSPFGSFLTLLGLETLHVRLERHSKNALAVAQFLSKNIRPCFG